MSEMQEINLSDIVAALKRRRRTVYSFLAIATLIGSMYAVLATPQYKTSVTIQPVAEDRGGLGGLAQSFGPAAALTGLKLGGGSATAEEYLAVLRSRELAERFIVRHDVKPILFPERWDTTGQTWKHEEPSLLRRAVRGFSNLLARISNDAGWREKQDHEPTDWEAYTKFLSIMNVSEDSQTSLVTVSFETRDPLLSAKWANGYVALANEEIRSDVVKDASRALVYLDEQVKSTSLAGLRETMFRLTEDQLELVMHANARKEYAFKVIDKAVVPEERSRPKRAFVVILSVLAGLSLGIFVALVRDFLDRRTSIDPRDPQVQSHIGFKATEQ